MFTSFLVQNASILSGEFISKKILGARALAWAEYSNDAYFLKMTKITIFQIPHPFEFKVDSWTNLSKALKLIQVQRKVNDLFLERINLHFQKHSDAFALARAVWTWKFEKSWFFGHF